MVTSRWTVLENNLFKLAQAAAHPNTAYFCTAASRPGELSAPGTSLPEQSELCAEWSNTASKSENQRAGELETLMQEKETPVPFNLQFMPLHYCEGHNHPYDKTIFKAEFATPLQNSMLDTTKFMLFCTCYLRLLIFSFQNHLIFVW